MIRVSGLRRQHAGGALMAPPDGMSPAQQLTAIYDRLEPQLAKAADCWAEDLQPRLTEAGINVLPYEDLKSKQRKLLRKMFKRELFPVLTPLASDPGHPFPHISNLSVNLAVIVNDPKQGERFARVKVPHMFPRLIRVPSEEKADPQARLGLDDSRFSNFVWLEEVVAANLDTLFPGLKVEAAYPFRVTRDADFEIEEDEAADLLGAMEEVVGQRFFGSAVRLELDSRTPQRYREMLIENLGLAPYQVYSVDGPIGQSDLMGLMSVDRPDLKDAPFKPVLPRVLAGEESLFSILKRRNILLYHPYDSFAPVVDFVRQAARDPDVLAIKQTLYRVGPNSPIVQALQEARENGKQVSVLVELKARFDEENNIVWARALEHAGVHVVYGLLGLKTHAKVCLVVRREPDGLMRYLHLGTGNYNPVTARIYSDIGYLTADPDLAADASHLFNALTGYSGKNSYGRLLVAPGEMRGQMLARIRREVARHQEERQGAHRLQDELAGRQGLHQGALPSVDGRGPRRSPGARHLLSEARRQAREREHHRDLGGRPLPRAHPDLLLPQRRRRGDPAGQRRPDAAEPGRQGRDAVPHHRSGDPGCTAGRHPVPPPARQRAVEAPAAGRRVRAPDAGRGRAGRQLAGRAARRAGLLALRRVEPRSTA